MSRPALFHRQPMVGALILALLAGLAVGIILLAGGCRALPAPANPPALPDGQGGTGLKTGLDGQKVDTGTIRSVNQKVTTIVKQSSQEVRDQGGPPLQATAGHLQQAGGMLDANDELILSLQVKNELLEKANAAAEQKHAADIAAWSERYQADIAAWSERYQADTRKMKADLDDLADKLEASEQRAGSAALSSISWMVVGCIPLAGLGLVLVLSGSKWGTGLFAGAGSTILIGFLAMRVWSALDRLEPLIPWFVGGLALLAVAFGGWVVFLNRKALVQTIPLVEQLKGEVSEGTVSRLASGLHDSAVSQLIDSLRKKMGFLSTVPPSPAGDAQGAPA